MAILLALLFSGLLGACGLKGPLYLPTDEPAAKPDTEESTESSAENEEQQDDDKEQQDDDHEC